MLASSDRCAGTSVADNARDVAHSRSWQIGYELSSSRESLGPGSHGLLTHESATLFLPSLGCCCPCDLGALLWRQCLGARQTTAPPKRLGGGILTIVGRKVFFLARSDAHHLDRGADQAAVRFRPLEPLGIGITTLGGLLLQIGQHLPQSWLLHQLSFELGIRRQRCRLDPKSWL